MLLNKLHYYNESIEGFKELEEWMKFSLFIGEYLKKYDGNIKLYVSVPSNLLFSYFTILGAVNYEFENITYDSMKEQYLQLQNGNKVYYESGGIWKKCSVFGVVEHPKEKEKLCIALLENKKTTVFVSEENWEKQIRIESLETEDIKNAYKIKEMEDLLNNNILNMLYVEDNIKRLQNRNVAKIFLYANKKEWLENMDFLELSLDGQKCNLFDFIYSNELSTQFENIDFISSAKKDQVIPNDVVIFLFGAGRSIRKMDYLNSNKCIYLINRQENHEKIEALKEKIEQQLIVEGKRQQNILIREALINENIEVPKGVELFAWE